jgi:hypothetical protein
MMSSWQGYSGLQTESAHALKLLPSLIIGTLPLSAAPPS